MNHPAPEHLKKTARGEPVTLLEAVSEGLFEEMVRDDSVFLMGEDIGVYGGAFKVTRGFLDYFGGLRVIDTPIAEGGFTGAAAGAAHMGLRPVVEMQFMDFISPAYDVLTNYIATSLYRGAGPMPIVVRGPVGGGNRGGPFHSQNVEMAFFHTPGFKIVYPSTAYDAKGLIKARFEMTTRSSLKNTKLYTARLLLGKYCRMKITLYRLVKLALSGRALILPLSHMGQWSTSLSRLQKSLSKRMVWG